MRFINLDLMRHPYNWIVITLMLGIAVLALTYLQPYFGIGDGADVSATPTA